MRQTCPPGLIVLYDMKCRIFYQGIVNHCYQRSADHCVLFYSYGDHLVYFTHYCVMARKYGVKVLSLCQMPDHVHDTVVAEYKEDLSAFKRETNKLFSHKRNAYFHLSSPTLEHPYGSAPKFGTKKVRTNLIYVGNNPVERKLTRKAEEYRWNYLAYASSEHPFSNKLIVRYSRWPLQKAVKEIKANVEQITSLMVSSVDDDRLALKERVEEALKHLIRQTLVQKNGDIFVFVTDEEQEVNREIERQGQSIEQSEIIAKVSELIFDGMYDEKKYRYPAFNGRYQFAFNQVVDNRPYKANQNNDLTLKILTPYSDEMAPEQTLRLVSGQSRCVLVALPDDRSFLEEIRTALSIEKFLRYDAVNTITKYEQIKEAKKVEMRDRNAAAKLFLEEALKDAAIFVNGDKVSGSARDIKTKINEAMGKLVAQVYHKLSYIDTAVSDSDIRNVLRSGPQQITLEGVNTAKNELALNDVAAYISTNTGRHVKTSMKSLVDRFMKAPYGFIEADVQWIVAKLFKAGDIAFFVNSEPVTLLSKSEDEIYRFITRKEYNERLMMDRRDSSIMQIPSKASWNSWRSTIRISRSILAVR